MPPVGELVTKVMRERGMKRSELALALGYRNINRGLRRVDACLHKFHGGKTLLPKIARALDIEDDALDRAVQATRRLIREERARERQARRECERRVFRPHLYLRHARNVPTNITAVAFFGVKRFKRVELPGDINEWPLEDQIETAGRIIREHYWLCQGRTELFGEITGYIYRRTFDQSYAFSVEGELSAEDLPTFCEPTALLQFGRKTINTDNIRRRGGG